MNCIDARLGPSNLPKGTSFVYDGPGFSRPIPVSLGEVLEMDGFIFSDLVLP